MTATVPTRRRPAAIERRTVSITVELTEVEAEALLDGAFTCTSPDVRRHQAGRRALLKLREAAERMFPRPPVRF